MPDPDPGGEGDVHITKKDGKVFDYDGVLYRRSTIYESDTIRILGRFFPVPGDSGNESRTYFGGIDVYTKGESQVYFDASGNVHVFSGGNHWRVEIKADTLDAIGHPMCSTLEPHPLQGVAHINVRMVKCPEGVTGERGIMIDGDRDGAKPEDYVVED